ncbi:hypothetical protein Patl1_19748 [Pistacia atlantica]|uniref:Uncharacterized protein n=1 Tax=Pistacia atlantica TaxID=434234 RepID=A0ACC1BMU2_9ROSI|nr:hypothetical protein Patl1_19748 [Pistacia atlantica]
MAATTTTSTTTGTVIAIYNLFSSLSSNPKQSQKAPFSLFSKTLKKPSLFSLKQQPHKTDFVVFSKNPISRFFTSVEKHLDDRFVSFDDDDDDKPREECGVVIIYSDPEASRLCYFSVTHATASWTRRLLKEAGAKEIHMIIASPPIISSCYYVKLGEVKVKRVGDYMDDGFNGTIEAIDGGWVQGPRNRNENQGV